MKKQWYTLLSALALCVLCFACAGVADKSSEPEVPEKIRISYLDSVKKKIDSLYAPIGQIEPGDWLAEHDEKFISLPQYCKMNPVRPDEKRKVIYVQPFSDLDSVGLKNAEIAAEYLGAFYGLKTVLLPVKGLGNVPDDMKRGESFYLQIKTEWFLDSLLEKNLPNDAVAMIGLTGTDLYPEDDWNFVFGQAYLLKRVGVWSISRLCVAGEVSENEQKECFIRLLKTASHETGHMFSVGHCTKYKCIMNGSNNLPEADRKPMWLCPDCLSKLCWNTQREPAAHFSAMKSFWEKYKGDTQAAFYATNLERTK